MSQSEFASEIGISRRSYIYKIKNEVDWTLKELIAVSGLTDEDITIKSGISTYKVKITKES